MQQLEFWELAGSKVMELDRPVDDADISTIQNVAKKIAVYLANREYGEISSYVSIDSLSQEDIEYFAEDYPDQIISPPAVAYDDLLVILVDGDGPKEWNVRMPLWTVHEHPSDLSIEFSVIKTENGDVEVTLENILVF